GARRPAPRLPVRCKPLPDQADQAGPIAFPCSHAARRGCTVNPLLEQFLSETRDFLQGIGEKLMELEHAPGDAGVMVELFRLVHTLKGNSGLFDFPEMTRVLHAGEDLMDAVRDMRIPYSQTLADNLLDAMDFVGTLCDEIEATGRIGPDSTPASANLAAA